MGIKFPKISLTVKTGLAIVCILGLFFFIGYFARDAMDNIVNSSYAPLLKADSIRIDKINADSLYPFVTKSKLASFKSEYDVIYNKKSHHLRTGKKFFSEYYAFTVTLVISYILLAVLIFQIANQGWSNINLNPILKYLFFVCFGVSTFLSLMSLSINMQDNYEKNFSRYTDYDILNEQMFTFLNTSNSKDSIEEKGKIDSILNVMSLKVQTYDALIIKMDEKNVSLDDILSKMNNIQKQTPVAPSVKK